ncbi:MAG: type II secretion system protein [Candidatus Anammoxibacter sp.]
MVQDVEGKYILHHSRKTGGSLEMSSTTKRGFTLIEMVVVLSIFAIFGAAFVPVVSRSIDRKRETATRDALKEFKTAIIGNPFIIHHETRTDFGYVGDMGVIPAKIEDLYLKGSQPDFVYDSEKMTGVGWNGPYIDTLLLEDNLDNLKEDGYGKAFLYNTEEFLDPVVGADVILKIASNGPDYTIGGNNDLSAYIYKSTAYSDVVGFVKDDLGNRITGVKTKINYPVDGLMNVVGTETDIDGLYKFTDIPYGNRSISVTPKLVYAPDSAITAGPNDEDIEARVTNYAADNIAVSSMKINYSVTPTAYFTKVNIGNNVVFNSTAPRGSSGDTITFSPIIVPGTGGGVSGKSFPIRIQSPHTQVAEINIGLGFSRGGTIRFTVTGFEDSISGNGVAVDMAGVTFSVTFNDGSTVLFSPERG